MFLRVQIMIMDVSLEPANPCRFDYFELEEGAPRRRRFCIWVTFGTWTFCQQEEPREVLSRFRLWHNCWVRREYCQRQVANQICFHFCSAILLLNTPRFRTDFSVTGRGFHIRYSTLCDTEVTGLAGVIESPNFPRLYPHNRCITEPDETYVCW